VAAIPSLHAAFALLVSVALWPLARRWWQRALLAAYPLAMGFALVYGGEHYVIDLLLGWAYVGLVLVLVGLGERWWRARRLRRAPQEQPAPAVTATG
jgi:membrane-associated phospholipid phosphatase